MSDQFPLKSDAFTGGGRLTAAQRSEGRDGAPLFELLNQLAVPAAGALGPVTTAADIDLTALTAAQIAALNRGLTRMSGALVTAVLLPAIADVPAGWSHTFNDLDGGTNVVSITADGTDTINGGATFDTSRDGQSVTVVRPTTGTDWIVLS